MVIVLMRKTYLLLSQQYITTSCLCEHLIPDIPALFNNRYRGQMERRLMKIPLVTLYSGDKVFGIR